MKIKLTFLGLVERNLTSYLYWTVVKLLDSKGVLTVLSLNVMILLLRHSRCSQMVEQIYVV